MMTFNPKKWIPTTPKPSIIPSQMGNSAQKSPCGGFRGLQNQFETVLHQIEQRCIDIAPDYESWRNLGFAIASEYGEGGRNYFHRLSQFYGKYDSQECNKQYTRCLRGKQGITIKTFFYLAKNAGIHLDTRRK